MLCPSSVSKGGPSYFDNHQARLLLPQVALPDPREPPDVDASKSDRELFVEAVANGWGDDFADVPLLLFAHHYINSGQG